MRNQDLNYRLGKTLGIPSSLVIQLSMANCFMLASGGHVVKGVKPYVVSTSVVGSWVGR